MSTHLLLRNLKLFVQLPALLLARRRLLNDPTSRWQQRVGHRVLRIDGRELHPRAQGYMDLLRSVRLPREHWKVPAMRASYETGSRVFGGEIHPAVSAEDQTVRLSDRVLPVRRYRPAQLSGDSALPGVVFFHGGGFAIGSLDTHDRVCRKLAAELGTQVLSIDYRLSPEHPLPAAIEDACEIWAWVQQQDAQAGFDPAHLAVCGDSAGAALCVALCDYASQHQLRLPSATALIYPPFGRDAKTPSRDSLRNAEIVLNGDLLAWFEEQAFYGETYELPDPDTINFANFPRSLIITCGFDPLRDEGSQLSARLQTAGVETLDKEYAHMFHGFVTLAGLFPEADEVVRDVASFFRPGSPGPYPVNGDEQ